MKKVICLILSLVISMLCTTAFASETGTIAEEPITIEVIAQDEPQYILVVDSVGYDLPHPLYMENGRTMVESSTLAQLIGVECSTADGFVSFTDGENVASLSLTAPGALLNDGSVVLDAYAAQKDEVVFVPLRFVAESFGCTVDFSPVFSEEELFLGAYISVKTNIKTNVDFAFVLPDSLSELHANILNITRTITGIVPQIVTIEADKYSEYVNSALLAGQKIMFLKDDKTAVIDGHKTEDLLASFSAVLELKDETFAFPITISSETLSFCVSKTSENFEEAGYFLSALNELTTSLSAPQE